MPLGPYEKSMKKRINDMVSLVNEGRLKKNKDYTISEFSGIVGIPKNSLYRWSSFGNDDFNHILRKKTGGWELRQITVQKPQPGVRLEGCCYGPFRLVRFPVIPRFYEWLYSRPRLIYWWLSRPSI